jgi:hypothetical protein
MTAPAGRLAWRLSAGLAVLMAVQALLGRALPGACRDEAWIRATWIGNDWLTLLLAVPVLASGLALARRGRARGVVLWLGGLGYAIYNYFFYLVGAVVNAFLPLYAALVVLAVAALVLTLAAIEPARLARAAMPRLPRRLIGGYLVLLGGGLCAIWIGLWASVVFAGDDPPGGEPAFRVVAALDLTLMVPALVLRGLLAWRGADWGIAAAAIATLQAALYLTVLATNALILLRMELVDPPGEVALWTLLAAPTWLAAGALVLSVQGGLDVPQDGPLGSDRRRPSGRAGDGDAGIHPADPLRRDRRRRG